MTEEQFQRARTTVRERMSAAVSRTEKVLSLVESRLRPLEESEPRARETLEAMDRASAKTPFGMLAYYYAKGMARARGPVALRDGAINDEYEEISEQKVAELKAQLVADAIDALNRVYTPVSELLNDIQNEALTLRHFSGAEPLLERFAVVLAQPWYESLRVEDLTPKGPWQLHWYYATLPYRALPHVEINARRRASIGSLHLLRSKLSALKSLLETTLTEIEFAGPRAEPAAVPSTWNDYSVHIAENANVEGSAIGAGSDLRRGLL